MIEQIENTSRELEFAQKALEQAKARLQKAKNKEAEKKRKEDAHNKIIMGGIVKKYFPECVLFTEEELNEILSKALYSMDCLCLF